MPASPDPGADPLQSTPDNYTVHLDGAKRRTVSGKTREEVRKKPTKAMSDQDRGLVFDAGALTVGQHLEGWLKDSVRDTVRESTYETYKYATYPHIVARVGARQAQGLEARARAKLLQGQAGRRPQQRHGSQDARGAAQCLGSGRLGRFGRAQRRQGREAAPGRKEIRPLSPEQARLLLEAARDDRLEALYVLAVTTGMREGELLGLKWADVDLEAGALRVRRTLTRQGGKVTLGEPKTKKSRRTVRLTPRAVEAVKRHRARQATEKLKVGSLYEDQGLVFAGEGGGLVNPSNLRQRSFLPLLKKAGLSGITFHDLRHTCASLLFQKNVHPKFVQELLGHASIVITLDTYSHMLPSMGGEATDAMGEALG